MSIIEDAENYLKKAATDAVGLFWYESDAHLSNLIKELRARDAVIETLHGKVQHNPEMWDTDGICHILDDALSKLTD